MVPPLCDGIRGLKGTEDQIFDLYISKRRNILKSNTEQNILRILFLSELPQKTGPYKGIKSAPETFFLEI